MTTLALRSLRHRMPTATATFLAVLLGTVMIGSFAGLVETATGPVSTADQEVLLIMGAVIGSWGSLLALFSLVSTIGVAVRRRNTEIGLLRTIGATPRQVRSLVARETLIVSVVAAGLGAVIAWPSSAGLLAALREAGMVSAGVSFGGGWAAPAITCTVVVGISLASAAIAGRRVTGGDARAGLAEQVEPRSSRWRTLGGGLLVATGISLGATTWFVTGDLDDPYAAMQTSGVAGILIAVGLAAFGPQLLRGATLVLLPLLDRLGVASHLAALTTRRRSHLLAPVLGPVMVFTATASGTLMLVGIDHRTLVLPPGMAADESELINTLNNVVVGMIAVFCAIMLVNALLAVIVDRRAEFARLRLVGGTPGQVRGAVLVESLLVAGLGIVLGLAASTATVVPFAQARGEGLVPDAQLWLPVAVAGLALVITVVAARAATRRALGGQAVDAVAAA